MRIGHLVPVAVEVTQNQRTYLRRRWRIISSAGDDMIAPWQDSKGDTQRLAKSLNILLAPVGVELIHVAVMLLMEEYYGRQWRLYLAQVWQGRGRLPPHLSPHLPVLMELKASRIRDWFDRKNYRRKPDAKTTT